MRFAGIAAIKFEKGPNFFRIELMQRQVLAF